jgi:hypothetical protein
MGIGKSTLRLSGWGNAIVDLNNDGWKDLFAAAGDVQDNSEVFSSLPSKQRSIVLLNEKGTFRAVTAGVEGLHRGAAFGDLDGDGAVDVALSRIGDKPVLLRNAMPPRSWIDFRLVGSGSNRDGLGARIRISAGGIVQWNQMTSAVGYASASLTPVHFGLGSLSRIEFAEIVWPSGAVQRLQGAELQLNSVNVVKEPASRSPQP